jgi:hypothetical protein
MMARTVSPYIYQLPTALHFFFLSPPYPIVTAQLSSPQPHPSVNNLHNMPKKNTAVSKAAKQQQSVVQPQATIIPRHIEPEHADDDPIYSTNFLWKELIPGWENFDPNTKNPATNNTFRSGHHTPGKSGKTERDFEKFVFGFCLEFIINKDGIWSRCCNQFTIKSGQCTTHNKTRFKDGPNRIWKAMENGKVGFWGWLKNTEIETVEVQLTAGQLDAKRREEIEDIAIKRCQETSEDFGTVSAELHVKLNEEIALCLKITKQEARGKSAAVAIGNGEQNTQPNLVRAGSMCLSYVQRLAVIRTSEAGPASRRLRNGVERD